MFSLIIDAEENSMHHSMWSLPKPERGMGANSRDSPSKDLFWAQEKAMEMGKDMAGEELAMQPVKNHAHTCRDW